MHVTFAVQANKWIITWYYWWYIVVREVEIENNYLPAFDIMNNMHDDIEDGFCVSFSASI